MTENKPKKEFMQKAIDAAIESGKRGDYAIGAVIVKNGMIVSIGYETLKSSNDPVNGHAEIDAIRKACIKLDKPYLENCELYSTHEPCPMCTAASIWAKIDTIVYGISREDMIGVMKNKSNDKFSWRQIDISCKSIVRKEMPKITVNLIEGFMKEECLKLLDFSKWNIMPNGE